jgi:hypothetical protein
MKEFKFKVFLKVLVVCIGLFLMLYDTLHVSLYLSSLTAIKNTSQFHLQVFIYYILINAFCIDRIYVPMTIRIMQ